MARLKLFVFIFVFSTAACGAVGENRHAASVSVPFALEHNEIIVDVSIDGGAAHPMMVDTDADPCIVSLELAQSLRLKLRKRSGDVTGGGSGHPTVYATMLPRVAIGGLPPRDLEAVAMDLHDLSARLGKEVHGVIGHNFLGRHVVQIDYPARTLRFQTTPESIDASRVVATLSFRYDDDSSSLVIEGVTVNGKKVLATADTGSDGTFKLTPSAVDLLGIGDAARNGTPQTSVGYRGAGQNTLGGVDEIAIGEIHLRSPEVVFFRKGTGRDHKPWGLNIGNAFLRDYVVTVDYPRQRIILQRP